jgi:hypothetical protein
MIASNNRRMIARVRAGRFDNLAKACYHVNLCCGGRILFGQDSKGDVFLSNLTTMLTVNATPMGIAQPCATLRLDADVNGVVPCGDVLNGV